jgi:hypothetical protein
MGLDAFGLRSKRIQPGKALLRHTRAVTEVRLALERTREWRDSGASWRSERQIRSGYSMSRDVHVPDGEVHWPADRGSWRAGEVWAVEVELIAKTIESTSKKMREVLTRTGEYDGPPASIATAGLPLQYQRMVWDCSPQRGPHGPEIPRRARHRARQPGRGLRPARVRDAAEHPEARVGAVTDWTHSYQRHPHHRQQRNDRETGLAVLRMLVTGRAALLARLR